MSLVQSTRAYHSTLPVPAKQGTCRIAFVYEGVAYGGTEEYILMMLRYLDRNRYTPIVVTSGYNYRFLPHQFVDKVDELRVPRLHTAIEQHSRLGSSIGDILNTTRLFRDTQTDIVHIHNQRPDGGRRATIAACLARVRGVIRSEHLPPSSNLKPWSRMLLKPQDWLTDYIVAGSDACWHEQIELAGRSPRKTRRIFYGIEVDRFQPNHDVATAKREFGLDPAIPTVGIIARLAPEKGHVYFFDAAARVIREYGPVNFLVVGTGRLEAELRAQVNKLGIEQYVHFLGFANDTIPFIRAMDITAMSSVSEGISLAMLEFMAMAKPVVATAEPSFAETIVDGESGVLVELKNADALAEGMMRVLRDPEFAAAISRGAYERVRAEFDINGNINRFMELYERLVQPAARPLLEAEAHSG